MGKEVTSVNIVQNVETLFLTLNMKLEAPNQMRFKEIFI